MNLKFEFTGAVKNGLRQIRAKIAIGVEVRVGDLGGWIENETCLDATGDAWVYGNARVYGDAWVYGNARVYGDARVYGNAWVYGNARVYGNAWVYGDARVSGDARVYGDARVSGNAHLLIVGPIGSRAAYLTATLTASGSVQIATGCFLGTLADFRTAVKNEHGDNEHGRNYAALCALVETKFNVKV